MMKQYEDGRSVGKWTYWRRDGTVRRMEYYEDDKLIRAENYKDGKLIRTEKSESAPEKRKVE